MQQMSQILQHLIKGLDEKQPLNGPDGLITSLLKVAYESALDGEVEAHLLEQNELEIDNGPVESKSFLNIFRV